MEIINGIIGFITKLIQWWFIVNPWEQAIRVRRGKKVKVLNAGVYLKIPFIDQVYIQTTRMRVVDTPMHTITSKDSITITIKLSIGYTINDILKLYKTLYHPETTLANMAVGLLSQYIRARDIKEIEPKIIEEIIAANIAIVDYGLSDFKVNVLTFATVKTYRMIQDSSHGTKYDDMVMNAIK